MTFKHTLIGAALGAPIAGPLGSLVGAVGGAILDYRAKPKTVASSAEARSAGGKPAPVKIPKPTPAAVSRYAAYVPPPFPKDPSQQPAFARAQAAWVAQIHKQPPLPRNVYETGPYLTAASYYLTTIHHWQSGSQLQDGITATFAYERGPNGGGYGGAPPPLPGESFTDYMNRADGTYGPWRKGGAGDLTAAIESGGAAAFNIAASTLKSAAAATGIPVGGLIDNVNVNVQAGLNQDSANAKG